MTEKPSKPSPPDSATPGSTTPTPRPDGSSQDALFQMPQEPSKPPPTDTDTTPTPPPEDTSSPTAFVQNSRSEVRTMGNEGDHTGALAAQPGAQQQTYLAEEASVRRLTPTECERLQGFPDAWTVLSSESR